MHRTLVLALALVTTAGAVLPSPPPLTALAPFEIVADGFVDLRGLAVDDDDHVYVADREVGTVTRLADGGRRIIARRLERPIGLAIDSGGRVLVAEERAGRIVRLDPGGPTVLAQGIRQPRWLTLGDDGTLYVSARRLTRDAEPEPDDESLEPEAILRLTPEGTLSVFADGFERLQGLVARPGAIYAATTGLRGPPQQGGVIYRIPIAADGKAGDPGRVGPRDVFERPVGLAIDQIGALFVSTPLTDLDTPRSRQAVVKVDPDGTATGFAAWLSHPRGLAFDSHGHLYVADGNGGRVLRFAAPPPPGLIGVPAFVRQPALTLTGTTVPHARVDGFLGDVAVPVTTSATGTGAFSLTLTPPPNVVSSLDVFATAARGKGLTSAPREALIAHDTIPPTIAIQTPASGVFVRGSVEIRVDAVDTTSRLVELGIGAAGPAMSVTTAPALPAPASTALTTWPTSSVADGMQTLTARAVDGAGNSAVVSRVVIVDNTPPDTEIRGGGSEPPGTAALTFAFGGSDNLTPPSSLQFAWRVDAGAWSGFSQGSAVTLTTLSPGPHVFEVLARDLAGNEDPTPARRAFTVGTADPVLAISEPSTGATVLAGSVIVRGTIDGAATDIGVSVNGIAALVAGRHWAAEIPLVPGANTITAVARMRSGAETVATVTVAGGEPGPGLVMRAEPSSGVAPFQVTWRVSSQGPRPLVTLELDPEGLGVFGPPIPALDEIQSTYATPGLRVAAVRATDDLGNIYLARTPVLVDDAAGASARFQALWAGFLARLQAADRTGALAHLTPSLRSRFEPVFQQLGPDLPVIAAGLGGIELIDQVGHLAEAAFLQAADGVTRLYFVYFRRDNRGQWLIQDM